MLVQDDNLYYVGGVVRDEILNAPNFDTDYCYVGNAINFAERLGLNIIKTNKDFGTVRVLVDGNTIDIASTRNEEYKRKGHLPRVFDIGCSLKEDLKRRDFTINAMAKKTTDGELVDYYGGLEDIKNKKLRVLHDNSFIDDPTRIIRGLKFSVRFGFELEEKTKVLQEEYLNNINYDMSYHRIKKELVETFNLNSADAYDKFIEQGIYKLLGENVKPSKISGSDIYNQVRELGQENCWLYYIAPFVFSGFDFEKIQPSRAEKRILEWAEKLKTQAAGNNTPKESMVIRRIMDSV